MNKMITTFLLGTASALLFTASFLTSDAAGYMDWAKESAPAIHEEMKSFKSSLPFHSFKEENENHQYKKDHQEWKQKDHKEKKAWNGERKGNGHEEREERNS